MVWWLLKKRDEEAHKKIDNIHNSIQGSFGNIRKDIEAINGHIKRHNNNSESFHKRLLAIEQKLMKFEEHFMGETEDESVEEAIKVKKEDFIEDLTQTQKLIFLTIYEMEKQLGQEISIRSLAELLYKEKEYDQVRSMLSRFISELTDLSLVKKKRVGKQVYVSTTTQGARIAKQAIVENKRKK